MRLVTTLAAALALAPAPVLAQGDVPIAGTLLDVSAEGCGERVPIQVRFEAEGDDYRAPNTLMVSPLPGYPLAPSRPHALVILRNFGRPNGMETIRPAEFDGVLEGSHSDTRLVESFAPLVDCLEGASLTAGEIAVAKLTITCVPLSSVTFGGSSAMVNVGASLTAVI